MFKHFCHCNAAISDVYDGKSKNKIAVIFFPNSHGCGLDPSHFLSAPGLAWQACLKKTKVNLELLTNVDMLLMIEAGIRDGICEKVHRHVEANNKFMKNYNKSIKSSYLMYLDANNLYGWAMSKKLPINGFKWENDLSRFNENFIKNYNENSDVGYFLEVDVKFFEKTFWFS